MNARTPSTSVDVYMAKSSVRAQIAEDKQMDSTRLKSASIEKMLLASDYPRSG